MVIRGSVFACECVGLLNEHDPKADLPVGGAGPLRGIWLAVLSDLDAFDGVVWAWDGNRSGCCVFGFELVGADRVLGDLIGSQSGASVSTTEAALVASAVSLSRALSACRERCQNDSLGPPPKSPATL